MACQIWMMALVRGVLEVQVRGCEVGSGAVRGGDGGYMIEEMKLLFIGRDNAGDRHSTSSRHLTR